MISTRMPATARLKDIVDALEMQFNEFSSFLDLETGEVETVSVDLLDEAESDPEDDHPDHEDKEWELAKRIVSTDRYQRLPTKYDVHEWEIMKGFAGSVESEEIRDDLLYTIHGPGAFRGFKNVIRRYRIEQDWFAFRTGALRQIAIDWCEEHHILWK